VNGEALRKSVEKPQDKPMNEYEIECQGLKKLLDEKTPFSLVDCRQESEHAICRIEGATLIPLHELSATFEEVEVEPELLIIVYCHHGVRSLNATAYLRKLGFKNTFSLRGGIDQWSLQVDANVERY
jgi:rhodanese-related sulfurtransferase